MSTPFWRSAPVAQPESSVALRSAVLATVLVAAIAIINEGLVGPAATIVSLIGIPLGFWWSHRRRHQESALLKLGIAIGLVFALVGFISQIRAAQIVSALDVQIPLAELFLWVQFLHSLHLPARRDLMFSLASSVVMLAVAAVLSVGMAVGLFLLLWAGGALVSLTLAHSSRLQTATALANVQSTSRVRSVAMAGFAVLGLAGLAFLVAPAARPITPIAFPSELSIISSLFNQGGFSNPSLGGGADGGDGPSDRASFGYFGFAESLDTSLRGRPDDTLVMRVRAPAPSFWRGQTFDVWDGRTWTNSNDTSTPISGSESIRTRTTAGDDRAGAPGTDRFVQTFYVERPGPNLIFGAYRIDEVFFTERTLFALDDGTLRTGVNLGAGSIYTVVSERQRLDAALLRSADPLHLAMPDEIRQRYLQLPAVPERVLDLARAVTTDAPTTYDKILALQSWMADNTAYSLDIPALPPGADAVDQYLFVDRKGFCEQIGSSLVVMLRSLGIPSRLVIGYTPGDRNPFTGLYEVKASDAHSWAEIYFPGVGWQGFDPTAEVPLYDGETSERPGRGLLSYLIGRIDTLPGFAGPLLKMAGAGAMLLIIGALGWSWAAERRKRRNRSWADATLAAFEEIGARRGRRRDPSETPIEYLDSLEGLGLHGAGHAGEVITRGAFGNEAIGSDETNEIGKMLDTLRAAGRR
jgi:transglutaminase-like putative cysteine protease